MFQYPHVECWLAHFFSIDKASMELLEAPFLGREIFMALKNVEEDKTPGPDGFPFKFTQSFWLFFKNDLLNLFQ